MEYYERHYSEYCKKVTSCRRERLAWSDLDLIRDIIFVLGTRGWQKTIDEDDIPTGEHSKKSMEAFDRLVERFKSPLLAAGVNLDEFGPEFEQIVSYACQCMSLSTLDYLFG